MKSSTLDDAMRKTGSSDSFGRTASVGIDAQRARNQPSRSTTFGTGEGATATTACGSVAVRLSGVALGQSTVWQAYSRSVASVARTFASAEAASPSMITNRYA